jgi:DNA-binding NtrC family response regulator
LRGELGRPRASLAPSAEAALLVYGWPGNVRELRNVIERAMIITASDEIGADDLGLPIEPREAEAGPAGGDVAEPLRLEDVEKRHIIQVLHRVGGSKTRAASMLGVSRSTLWEKAKRYGIV